jgi:hypothetical protein
MLLTECAPDAWLFERRRWQRANAVKRVKRRGAAKPVIQSRRSLWAMLGVCIVAICVM